MEVAGQLPQIREPALPVGPRYFGVGNAKLVVRLYYRVPREDIGFASLVEDATGHLFRVVHVGLGLRGSFDADGVISVVSDDDKALALGFCLSLELIGQLDDGVAGKLCRIEWLSVQGTLS